MVVTTERFGELDVPEDRVLSFPDALPGFPEAYTFVLVNVPDSDVYFWIQSLDDPALAFLCAIPWEFFPDYAPEVPDDEQEMLGLTSEDDAMVLCLLTVQREDETITANLLGPLVINQQTRLGRQVVLYGDEYPVQAPLAS